MQQQEFKNMKFRVKDEEHSKKIQEYLFSLGYHWRGSTEAKISRTSEPFLFVYADRTICHGQTESYFENKDFPEYQLKETKSYSLEEVKPVKTIFATLGIDFDVEVTLNGEKISFKELKELLNKE